MQTVRKNRSVLSFMILLVALTALFFISQGKTNAETAPTPPLDGSKYFTITQIQPDLKNQTVRLTFSGICSYEQLRNNLKIYPPARLDWYRHATSQMQNLFLIEGQFKPGQRYSIMVSDDFECNKLKYQKTLSSFVMPDQASNITFVEKGTVIERDGRQMIHANLTNVDELLVVGFRVPPILVPLTMHLTRSFSYEKIKPIYEQQFATIKPLLDKYPVLKEFSGELLEEKQLFFPGKNHNVSKPFSIPLRFRKDREKGAVELISFKSNKNEQPAETLPQTFLITDIGLTYKISNNTLMIWATSIHTGKPQKEISLLAVTRNMTAIPLGKTGENGVMMVKNLGGLQQIDLSTPLKNRPAAKALSIREIGFVLAASPTDHSFIEIYPSGTIKPDWVNQSPVVAKINKGEISATTSVMGAVTATTSATQGEAAATTSTITETAADPLFKGHLFTERGIYRPGETVYFKGTVREYKNGGIVPPTILTPTLQIVNAKDEIVYDNKMKLSEFGTFNDSLLLKPYFPLGTYTMTLFLKGDEKGAQRTFQVLEFKPPRHFTAIHFKFEKTQDKRYINIEKEISFLKSEIRGTYYAGGPVKHGKVRWNIYYYPTEFRKVHHKNFTFGNPREKRDELIETGESMLSEDGTITVNVPLNKKVASGFYGVEVQATVVDFDGKAASESAVYQVEPNYLVGISRHKESVNAGDSELLTIIVIDKQEKPLETGKIFVEVMRKDYSYIQKRNNLGDVTWDYQEVWRKYLGSSLHIENGRAVFDFDFLHGGDYLIQFTYQGKDDKRYTSGTRYAVGGYFYGYEYEHRDRNFERLSVSPEKDEYAPGESIRLFIHPHKTLAALLVTVERGEIIEYKTIIPTGKRYVDIPVKKDFSPNVYISFLGTVARGEFPVYDGELDDEAPAFLFGVANIEIRKKTGEMKVTINEDEASLKSEPAGDVKLKLIAKDLSGKGVRAELAVAVVDESVLAMTGFATPTLETLTQFIAPLSVFTGDLRSLLLKQTPFGSVKNEPLTGGDGLDKTATSKIRKDFNPVAYFNPTLLTNDKGEAEVTFKLPDSMTTYRVYVIGCDKGSRFASTQRSLLVVKEFYLEPGVPRFFTRGDTFTMLVAAFNKSDQSAPMNFSLGKDNKVTLSTESLTYPVKSMDRTLIPVKGFAILPGISKLLFSGTLNGKSDTVEMSVPVNSGYPLMTDLVFGTFKNSAKIRYPFPEGTEKINWADLKPDEVKVLLTVSGSPFLQMSQGLRYLLHYPYGCVEQTSSGVLPLAGLRGLIKEGLIPNIGIEETDKFLKPGISRLLSMQTDSGGFAYWPGDLQPNKWGTIYATMALTHAKLAGFDVPQNQMDIAMNYLKTLMGDGGQNESRESFTGFVSYILAQNGALDETLFKVIYKGIANMPREGALLTLLAAKITGYLPEDDLMRTATLYLEKRWVGQSNDYAFYARYREPAIALLTANAILPHDPITGSLVKELLGGITREGIWTSTSDTGWSLVALGAYFKGAAFTDQAVKVSMRQEGWPTTTITLNPTKSYTYVLEPSSFLKAPEVNLSVEGDHRMVYSLSLTYPRVDFSTEGYSRGFKIYKGIENTDGGKVIKVGDVVKVILDIDILGRDFNYIVLDDPLPAGFVAINSAIKTEESLPGKKKGQSDESEGDDYYWDVWDYEGDFYHFVPNYFEMRDDRVLVFKDRSWKGRFRYSYYARAVIKGEFILPSTKIQLMYDPNTVSYTPASKVVIEAGGN